MWVKQIWVALVALGLAAPAASASVITVGASKDNSLLEDSGGALSGGASTAFFVGRLGPNGSLLKRRGAIAFDLSAIPANAVVSDVSMTLTLLKGNGGVTPVELHRLTKDWGEGTSSGGPQGGLASAGSATWLHNSSPTSTWTNPGGDFDATVSGVQGVGTFGGAVTWNSTPVLRQMVADVQRWVTNSSANFGWILVGDEVNSATAKEFTSREGFSGQPALTVTYSVPEPGMIGATAAIALAALGRRRARRASSGR